MSKRKKLNRYNLFQKQLSNYIKDNNLSKSEYKEYRKLYKEIDKSVPNKRIYDVIPVIISKYKASLKKQSNNYETDIPFYNAKGEFSLPKYSNIVLNVKFDDGGLKLDWTGTPFDFNGWFSGDVMSYFRNNYNDSSNIATFVLKNVKGSVLEYEIEVQGGSLVGTKSYVPPDKDIVIKDKKFRDSKEIENQQNLIEFIDKKTKLIEQMKSLGYSNDEIKAEIKKLDDKYYGKDR